MQAISRRTCAIIGVVGLLLGGCRETEKRVPTGPGGPLFGTIGTPNKQDWKQCQNNKNNPDDVCNWVTGNLDASHNVYHEGDFVPHALRIGGVQNTDAFSVVMTYGFLKGGKTSHDFLGVWNQTMHNANPCVDGSYTMFCSAGSPGTLTGPFVTSNSMATLVQNAVNAACGATSQYALDMAHAISAVGADKLVYTGQNVSDITVNSIAFDGCPASGDAEATVTLTVKPTITAVVAGKTDTGLLLLVASHVARTWFSASVGDWHNGGAFDISGSPYHLGLLTVDGKSSGSMDLQMAAQAIVVLGDLYWEKHAGSATGALLGGATFNVCLTGGSCVSVTDNSPPDTDPTAGKFHMTGLALGTYTITETAAPAGYNVDPTPQSVTLTFTLPTNIATPLVFVNYQPGAKISIAQTATNGITVPHTFTVTVQKDPEGDGTFVAAAGVTVTLTLTAAGGASLQDVTNACSTGPTDSSGQCTATFTSPTAGTVTGHATASVTIGAVTVSLATDGTGNNSGDAVKTYVAGTLKWLKNDQAGQPLAGATFSYCLGAQTSCPTVTDNSTPDADAAAGKFQINGLVLGTYTICETVAPAGYTKDPNCQNVTLTTGATVGTATNAFVNLKPSAKISIATAATNGITVPHTFTVTLQKDPEGDGTFVAANGEHVDVTLTNGGGASYVLDAAASTCDDAGPNTDSNGQCTMKFSSATAGTVTGHATASLTVGGVALSVATDGTGNNSGDAVKTYVAGTLKWLKNDQAGQPLAGATFSYCLGADCHNVTDNSAPDADAAAGKFQINGLVLGTYQICETAAPAGYTKDPNCQNVTLTTGAPEGSATNAFVNLKPSAKISIAADATNGITVPHTFTVTLMKNLGNGGGWQVASGEHVDVTLTNGSGASYVLDGAASTCDDAGPNTDSNGQCTMKFSSATAGTVTGHATANLTVGGVALSVATDGTGGNSGDAVKTYVAGTLKWLKNDEAGQPLAGATFSYCLGADCHNVTDNSAPDANATAGKFQINGLVLGTYQICETAAPAGYTKDPNCQNVTLTVTDSVVSATNPFVNLKPSAKISIATTATNGITVPHTFTVTLQKDPEGDGTFVAANGEHVDVTLTNGSGASYVLDAAASTCDDAGPNTDSNGQCTMKFSSATAGTVTGHATSSLTVGGVALSVATDGTGNNSGDAVKTYVAGTLKWLKNDQAGQALAGATFSYCLGAQTSCPTVTDNSTPDANAAAGKFQINGLVLGTYTICETAAPAGYTKDPTCQNVTLTVTDSVVSATNAFVNPKPSAAITIASAATNGITVPHTFTVTLTKDPGDGSGSVAASGEHVDVTLTNAGGASYVLDAASSTCDDAGANTDSNGQCTMKFSSATAGTVTGHATASLTVGGVALSVATDGSGNNSGDAVKTYVAGTLKWLKNDQAGQALAGATFSYCLGAQTSCPTVTDNSTPDADAAAGKFQINGLVLGTYTICETAAPAGYAKDPTCQQVTLTTGSPVGQATNAFVNTPTTRSGIYPTQTTCQDFSAGTATILSTLSAGLKGNNINNVSPGVFFYYASVIPVTATDQIAVAQSNTQGLNNFLVQQGQAYLYDATCNRLPFTLTLSSDGTQVIDGGLSGLTPGATYYVGIKYDPSSVVGQQVRYNGVVTKLPDPYTYVMTQNGGASFNSATITLVQK